MKQFLENAIKGLTQEPYATWYKYLGNNLYLVVGKYEDNGEICGKIAVNCDDLQCDYDIDWNMPYYEDGEVCFTELGIDENDLDSAVNWFTECYNEMKNWNIDERGLILSE